VGLEALVAGSLERVSSGFGFTEGPVWHPREQCLYFTDIPNSTIYRLIDDRPVVWRSPSNKANGLAIDAGGRLLICEHETFRVTWSDRGLTGIIADSIDGKPFNGPNDVIAARDGTIFFTDTDSTRNDYFGVAVPPQLEVNAVYRVRAGEVEVVADDFLHPNGLCFSLDQSCLLVNDTKREHIRIIRLSAANEAARWDVFFGGIGTGNPADGVPDGMKLDEEGNIYCTGPHGIWVIDGNAKLVGVIQVPEFCGNFTWGGSDMKDLYICASTSLYRTKMEVGPAQSAIPGVRRT
jgi:gluconolactonase